MGVAVVQATDYYERLGLDKSADRKAIKVAYARALREYPPERFPEEFKRIREAYETLFDPESREEYDSRSDPNVARAIDRGQAALAEGDFEKAAAAFRRALVIRPTSVVARNLLGLSYLYSNSYENALEQFKKLTAEHPSNATYWESRGAAERGLEDYGAAEGSYRQALELGDDEESATVGLARVLMDDDRYHEADTLLEQAIHADGIVDFDDISFFFELIRGRIHQQDLNGLRNTVERVERSLTEDWQRERVAYRFATIAQELVSYRIYEPALALAEKSAALAPDDEDIAALTSFIRRNRDVINEWDRLQDDDAVRPGLKFLFAVVLQTQFGEWDSEDDARNAIQRAMEVLHAESTTVVAGHGDRRTLTAELRYIANNYPQVNATLPSEFRVQVQRNAGSIDSVLLTCPHCGHKARAKDETGRYTCPGCGKNFDYSRHSSTIKKRSMEVETSRAASGAMNIVIQIALWVGLFTLLSNC